MLRRSFAALATQLLRQPASEAALAPFALQACKQQMGQSLLSPSEPALCMIVPHGPFRSECSHQDADARHQGAREHAGRQASP